MDAINNVSTSTSTQDIVDTFLAAGHFKTLSRALKAADLVGTLRDKGPYTVIAPTDELFKRWMRGFSFAAPNRAVSDALMSVIPESAAPGSVPERQTIPRRYEYSMKSDCLRRCCAGLVVPLRPASRTIVAVALTHIGLRKSFDGQHLAAHRSSGQRGRQP